MDQVVAGTFIFTDLVSSTEMASRMSAAEADALRQRHFGLLRGAIDSTGGREVKNLGDGLMVVFSSPSRALSCAVEMQQAVERNNRRSEIPLSVRIGLATGEVTEEAGDFFGDPVVEAARLCSVAEGGQILATDLLRMTVGRHATQEFAALGDKELKGLPVPVAVVEVLWEPTGEPTSETAAEIPLPSRLAMGSSDQVFSFAGRLAEMSTLSDALKQVSAENHLRVVLLGGEPGVGKSRIAAQFARQVHQDRATVLFGECSEGTNVPYLPWINALSQLFRHADAALWEPLTPVHSWALRRLLPAVADRIPSGEAIDTDPETEQFLLMESVGRALELACGQAQVVIVLDDLHWADSASLTLLRHLVVSSADISALFVATYRTSDLSHDHPLTSLLADLHREPSVRRVDVGGLGDEEIIELIEKTAGYELDDQGVGLAHALKRETGGNPFFVSELLRHLVESGSIAVGQAGRFEMVSQIDELGLPESVRDVVVRRVSRLGEEAHRILTTASVIGREFDVDVLCRVADIDIDRLLDVIDSASAAALVTELETAGRYRFTHALVEHALYAELSTARRQRAHLKVAEILEATPDLSTSESARVGDLARHWQAATKPADATKAIEYTRLAADMAMATFSPADAVRWYSQAVELIEREAQVDERLHFEILLRLATAQLATDQVTGIATLRTAGLLVERIGDSHLFAAWANARLAGWRASEAADPEFLRLLEVALSKVDEDDKALRARLIASLADETDPDDWRTRQELATAARAAAVESGDAGVRLEVFLSTNFLTLPEEAEQQLARSEDAFQIAIQSHDPVRLTSVLLHRTRNSLVLGDIDRARSSLKMLEELATTYPLPAVTHNAASSRAAINMVDGHLQQLEVTANEMLEIGLRGFPAALAGYGGALFELGWAQARLAEYLEVFSNAGTDLRSYAGFRPAIVLGMLEAGRIDEARDVFDQDASSRFEDFPRDSVWLSCLSLFSDASMSFGDRDAAQALYELLVPFGHLHCTTGPIYYGVVNRSLGRLASLLGDLDEGERRLRLAVEEHARIGASYWKAVSLVDLTEVLLSNGSDLEDEHVRLLVDEARQLAERDGYGSVTKRLDRLVG